MRRARALGGARHEAGRRGAGGAATARRGRKGARLLRCWLLLLASESDWARFGAVGESKCGGVGEGETWERVGR
jgi:hypothetical protein